MCSVDGIIELVTAGAGAVATALLLSLHPGFGLLAGQSGFETARSLQQQGNYVDAERQYRAFLKQEPESVPALTNLGVVLAHEGNFDQAIEVYYHALSIDANATPAKVNLALAYYRISDWPNAQKWLNAVLEIEPSDKRARQLLAITCMQSGQYADAAAAYERLLPSEDPAVLIGLSSAYRELGKKKESEQLLTQIIRDHPQSPEVHYLLGLAEYARQDYEAAITSFTQTTNLAPTRVDGYFYLGATYFKQRRFDQAIQIWKKAVRVDPEHFPSIFALGALLAELDRYEEAKPYLQQALTQRPHDAATNFELGRLYLREGQLQAALPLLKAASQLDPKSQQASFLLATVYRKLGSQSEAAAEFERSRRLLSEDTLNGALSEAMRVNHQVTE